MRFDEALRAARNRFTDSPTPDFDAEVLLEWATGRSRTWMRTWPSRVVEIPHLVAFREMVARREAGEPVAYITGERDFFGRSFRVTPDTLIPRAETEHVVEATLDLLPSKPSFEVVDLGTGCGAIGVTLAAEQPLWNLTLVDTSDAALAVARENARRHGAYVKIRKSFWLEEFKGKMVDVVVGNPPYVAPGDPHLRVGDLRFEPGSALVAEDNGLADLRIIIKQASELLPTFGWLVLEHGYNQSKIVHDLFVQHGFKSVFSRKDLAGNHRVTMGHG